MYKLGSLGKELIKEFEQCRLTAYQDTGGVWTIGWGHTGPEVVEGLTCTQDEADAWFTEDVQEAIDGVATAVNTPLTQNQFDALVSFQYNTGAITKSTLLKKLNLGDYAGAAREFTRWIKDDGVELRGLLRRRLREQALFTTW